MKKVLAIVLVSLLLTGLFIVNAGADSYIFNLNENLGTDVLKADPSDVVKDGVIGENEYTRFIVNNDPDDDNCDICVVYDGGDYFDKACAMMKTAEFYFSWDDVHGLNVGVRYKPETIKQVLDIEEGDYPTDDFLKNTGILLFLDYRHEYVNNDVLSDILYYAAAKRTTDGKYLLGHYNQLGVNGDYAAHPGEDLIIEYGDDGYVTCEWSVPIETTIKGSYGAGTNLYITLSLMSGDDDVAEGGIVNFYGIGLGYYGYAMKATGEGNHCTLTLSDASIKTASDNGGSGSEPDDIGGNTENGGNNGTETDAGNTDSTEKGGDVTPVDGGNGAQSGTSNKPATKTGDAMVILAVVSALSAGGFAISKKRR